MMKNLEEWFMFSPLKYLFQRFFEMKVFNFFLTKAQINLHRKIILDAGTGAGFGIQILTNKFQPKELHAFDVSRKALSRAFHVKTEQTIISKQTIVFTSFASEKFDAIFIFGVLHHVPEWSKAIEEMCRVLKPGGVLLLDEHNKNSAKILQRFLKIHHPQNARFSWEDLRSAFWKNNLNILMEKSFFPGFGFFLCQKN